MELVGTLAPYSVLIGSPRLQHPGNAVVVVIDDDKGGDDDDDNGDDDDA